MSDERFYSRRFIKVGNLFLNPANIVSANVGWDGALYVATVGQTDEESSFIFRDLEKQAVLDYLTANSIDLLSPVPTSDWAERAEYKIDNELPY